MRPATTTQEDTPKEGDVGLALGIIIILAPSFFAQIDGNFPNEFWTNRLAPTKIDPDGAPGFALRSRNHRNRTLREILSRIYRYLNFFDAPIRFYRRAKLAWSKS